MTTRALVAGLVALVLAGCAGTTSDIATTSPGGASEQIPISVMKPDGAGPFPAVVVAHDCSGLGTTSSGAPTRWARELVSRGYATLIPDSFTTRGFPGGVCTNPAPKRNDVAPARRVPDIYAALAHARTLPYVDGRRVGLMGGSHGGSTTLASMLSPDDDTLPIGEKDDWTPAEPCRRLTEAAQKAGYPMKIKIYPGAHHHFDSHTPVRYVAARINANAPGGRGATTGGDPKAWADAIDEVVGFFAEHLK